jgi:hypothetical protein
MGQNVMAELSKACLKSSKAGSYNNAVCNQQTPLSCPSGISNFAYCLQRVLGQSAIRKGIGSDMAQMPTRPLLTLVVEPKEGAKQ